MARSPSTSLSVRSALSPRQNWILDPVQDGLWVIGAPLITLALALLTFTFFKAATATAWIIVTHIVFTVAHHMPTFIRIYGDVDLFRRFKWSFVFGPLLPFAFAMGVLSYLIFKNHPVEDFFYLLIILTLWDPWHFLMQHYGFMRIYDRPNVAPKRLAARMDLTLCATWFVFILLSTGEWLPGLLEDLYVRLHLPFVLSLPVGAFATLTAVAGGIAVATTAAYVGYLFWCWRKGFFISSAKLTLCVITFGVMYLTYTPNAWILRIAPGWTFKVGFAVLGVVHVTQYLAIVWRYNRSLAARPERSRPGLFRRLHAKGGLIVGVLYVGLCLAYGGLLTQRFDSARWLMAILLSVGFTSTLMHYYFDGFIWKVRHQQNREALAMNDGNATSANPVVSWWGSVKELTLTSVFARQLLYFGVPMVALTIGAWTVWREPAPNYVAHMYKAYRSIEQGAAQQTREEVRFALADMDRELPIAQKLAELHPTASHKAALAFLVYSRAHYQQIIEPKLLGQTVSPEQYSTYAAQVDQAIRILQQAVTQGGSLAHLGRENITDQDIRATLAGWQRELDRFAGSPSRPSRLAQ